MLISGLLTSIGKTSREVLIAEESTKFVAKIRNKDLLRLSQSPQRSQSFFVFSLCTL